VTTLESFQALAALGAAAGIVGLLLPALRGGDPSGRRAGTLAMTVAAWLLLVGSLVSRDDLSTLADHLHGPTRIGAAVVGGIAAILISVLTVRIVLRRPVVWLVLLAIAMPIRVPISFGGARDGNLLLPLYWVLAIGIIALAWDAARGRLDTFLNRTTPLDLPIAAFVAFSLTSILWTGDVNEATVKAVFFYIPFVLLYRVLIEWWTRVDKPLLALAVPTIALATATALVALGQFATKTIWWNDTLKQGNVYNRFFRANGIFFDPNILGRYLMIAIVAVVAYAVVVRRGRDLVLLGVAAAVLAAGLVVTFSRSSALGLMVALAFLAFRAFGWRRTLLAGAGVLVLIGAPAVALNGNVRDKATSVERLAGAGEGRFRLVEGGIDLWKTEPVVGVGLGAFSERYRETLPPRQQLRTRVVISHTAPATVLAEIGAVGFALFLVLFGAIGVVLWRSSRRGEPEGWAQLTVLAMIAGIFVHSMLYSALFEDPYLWALAAIGVALGAQRAAEARDTTRSLPVVAPAGAG
jgi:O-antigen ligase